MKHHTTLSSQRHSQYHTTTHYNNPITRQWQTARDALAYFHNHIALLEMEGWNRMPERTYVSQTMRSESYEIYMAALRQHIVETITTYTAE